MGKFLPQAQGSPTPSVFAVLLEPLYVVKNFLHLKKNGFHCRGNHSYFGFRFFC